jgi:hypothetical protein
MCGEPGDSVPGRAIGGREQLQAYSIAFSMSDGKFQLDLFLIILIFY